MRALTVILICFILAPAAFAAPVSLQDAVQLGVKQSPNLSQFRLQWEALKEAEENAYYAFFPSIDLTSSHGILQTRPATTLSTWSSQFQIAMTETLYNNGANLNAYESARLRTQVAKLRYENEKARLALSITRQFLSYSLASQLQEVQKTQFELLSTQFRTISRQFRQGVRTRRDFLRIKAEVRRSEIDLRSLRGDLEIAASELERLLNHHSSEIEFAPEIMIESEDFKIPAKPPDLSAHYQFQISNLQEKIFANQVRLAERERWPVVTLTAGLSYGASNYLGTGLSVADSDSTVGFALLNLNFNILDWGIRKRNQQIAHLDRLRQENEIEASLAAFRAENRVMMTQLRQSYDNLVLSRELLEMEQDSFSFLNREYRNGKVPYVDLVVGLRDLLNAKVRKYTSYFALRSERYRLKYHQGILNEDFGI